VTEGPWHDVTGASAGGSSKIFETPLYQAKFPGVIASGRNVPDLVFAAAARDGTTFYFGGTIQRAAGGTPLASAVFGAALADINRLNAGRSGFLNPILYLNALHVANKKATQGFVLQPIIALNRNAYDAIFGTGLGVMRLVPQIAGRPTGREVPKRGEVITKQDAKPNGAHPNVTSESEMPFAGGAIAATMGVDHGNYGTLPFYRMTEDLVMHNVRGWSSDTQFVAGLKQHQSNPNTGFCGAVFDHIFDSASVVTQDIVDYENELALAVGQGNVPAFLSCSYYESQNEWDNVGKPNPASLSTATTANAIAYETLAKGFPGSYCTDQDNYYLCSGMYVKVNDSANTEYVQVVCPETNGCTTHWSATFRYAHVAGTPISIDWAYQAAQHQLLLYNTLKANSSHPEFAKLVLTTIPFAQATNVAAAESAQESVTGRHL